MKQVKKSVLLWHTPAQMYALVTDVASYPRFLPWCSGAEVLSEDDAGMQARLHMSFGGVKQSFETRNTHVKDERVGMSLVNGPFSHLRGEWRFLPLADGKACRVEFELEYAFGSVALQALISPVFDRIAASLVDSFVQRADEVHGDGA
ncbi:MAG: type II toxin-antitoxin system RatA family toxin [Burkholderiaceae bacterium]|nr:MAG: type II toxin-antitoxin system RatA family toxin [Burkholderiaceae bacterium]